MKNKQEIIKELEDIVLNVVEQIIEKKQGPCISLPTRDTCHRKENVFTHMTSCQEICHDPDFDLDEDHLERYTRTLKFDHLGTVKNFTCAMRLIKFMIELVQNDIYSTKRDIYYTDVVLFGDQKRVDILVDDFACLLRVSRKDLHIIASSKGVVAGNIQFEEDGREIDCRMFQTVGKPITPFIERIRNIRSKATCLIILEKDAILMRLLQDGFCLKNNECILISGRGYPDVATRSFVVRVLKDLPHMKALVLVDADPHGLEIANVYINGSASLWHYSKELTLPLLERNKRIKWIGLSIKELSQLHISDKCFIPLSSEDRKKATNMINTISPNSLYTQWLIDEMEEILKCNMKAEVQALSSKSIEFIANIYLPHKIAQALSNK